MRYKGFKRKMVFTFGVYFLCWRYSVACGLRDDFGVRIDPGHEVLLGFVPVYGAIRWWRFLGELRAAQQRIGMAEVISPARAFWWSSLWFGGGPYINRHVNALYIFKQCRSAAASPTPLGSAPVPWGIPAAEDQAPAKSWAQRGLVAD
jgi:hypothetical protein